MRKRDITPSVAARLVASQFPQWADLRVTPVELDGWDNTTFRLGDQLSIRLPSHDRYVPQVHKEHRWLPVLAGQLPLPIPEPVAVGEPDETFPRPWAIRRWVAGETARADRIEDLTAFATHVAGFLAALYSIDASAGPAAGPHSFFRGGPLSSYDAQSREAIRQLGGELDAERATAAWEAALASSWDRSPVWVHGDVDEENLLVSEGALSAVIDFGCSAVGDPACDLGVAWTFLTAESRNAFRDAIGLDDATWARGCGWALWKALITLAQEKRGTARSRSAARRSSLDIIDLALAELSPGTAR